ncbi:hypothetical protein QAD02_007622 [Eretmocerus hayati]|nr:hypothetical protein QAD02_007622 [Eretmocerus hayati]
MTDFVSVDQNQTKQNRSNGDEDIPENDVNTEQRLENPELEVHSINEFNAGEDLASVISRGEIQHHSMEERIDINDNDDSPANDMSSSLVGGTVSEDQDNPKSYGDISEWPASMSTMQAQVDYWVRMGNSSIQNSDLKILQSKSVKQQDQNKVRQCTPGMFTRIVKKKRFHRSWLCFSPISGKIYCFQCKLFIAAQSQFTEGFCDWKNAYHRLHEHETSHSHLSAMRDFTVRASSLGTVNVELQKQIEDQVTYWKELLKRVIDVVMYCGERNLPLRGDNEILGDPSNGHFLGIIELMSHRDPFLKTHLLKYGGCGSGNVSYLSKTT